MPRGAAEDPQWVANLEAAIGPATIELGAATLTVPYDVVRPGDRRWEELYGLGATTGRTPREYE